MSRKFELYFTLSGLLITLGSLIFVLTACSANWRFKEIINEKYETNIYETDKDFEKISIVSDTADITILPSEDGKSKIVAFEHKREKHAITVENSTLTVNIVNEKKWFDYVANFGTPSLKIYIPEGEYKSLFIDESTGDISIPEDYSFESVDITLSTGNISYYASASETLKIHLSTGDITLGKLTAGVIDLKVSTGKTTIEDVTCESLKSIGDTGDAYLYKISATDNVYIERSTGNVEVKTSEAEKISIKTSSGDVNICYADFSGEIKLETSSGKSNLADVKCESLISTGNTGDISLSGVIASATYSIERRTGDVTLDACDAGQITITTSTGDVEGTLLTDKVFIHSTSTGKVNLPETTTGGKCKITTGTGNIKISIIDKSK